MRAPRGIAKGSGEPMRGGALPASGGLGRPTSMGAEEGRRWVWSSASSTTEGGLFTASPYVPI